MRVVLIMMPSSSTAPRDAQIGFHLAAGADTVLVGADSGARAPDLLGRFDGHDGVRLISNLDGVGVSAPARLARVAHEEHGADWVIEARDGEFWWPRGLSFHDVLAPMPPRYGIVQGLVREFVPRPDDGRPPWERSTVRRSLLEVPPAPDVEPGTLLRPAYRAHATLDPGASGGGPGTLQPLRAWYPLEVLSFGDGAPLDDGAVERGLEDGSLVVDERLRDGLAALEHGGTLPLRVPDVVDDAAYAGECAAVGEVDLERLDRQIRELEGRIAELESRLWPRVVRLASRLARRTS